MSIYDDPQHVLHKYYISANMMRRDFDKILKKKANKLILDPEMMTYLVLWYSCLYVVIEGWSSNKFNDPIIDTLLKDKKVNLLKGCRHDTFHFQKKYFPSRQMNFLADKTSVAWVRNLNSEFGRYFLEEIEKRKKKVLSQKNPSANL